MVFIKEIVPKAAITFVANSLYNEHYETQKMKHRWETIGEEMHTEYAWRDDHTWQKFSVISGVHAKPIPKKSETEFIIEHYWGYSKRSATKTTQYEVTHPRWDAYDIKSYTIDVNFGKIYGTEFDSLSTSKPISVMLAEGSEITVEGKSTV